MSSDSEYDSSVEESSVEEQKRPKTIMDLLKEKTSMKGSAKAKKNNDSVERKIEKQPSILDPEGLKKLRQQIKEKRKNIKKADGGGNKGDMRVKKIDSKETKAKKKKGSSAPIEVLSNQKVYDPNFLEKKRQLKNKEQMSDPRFSDLHGNLDLHACATNYAFLNDIRQQEKEKLLNTVTTGKRRRQTDKKSIENIENAKRELQRITDQEKRRSEATAFREKKKELQEVEKQKILRGQKAYYHSTQDIRKQVRKEELHKLGEKSREKILAKREKRKAAEEKKILKKRRE